MPDFTTVNPVAVGDNMATDDHLQKLEDNNARLLAFMAVGHEIVGAGRRAGRHINLARYSTGGTMLGDSAEHTLLSFVDPGTELAVGMWRAVCVFGSVAAVWTFCPGFQTTITEFCKAATRDLSGGAYLSTVAGGETEKYVTAEPALPWVGFNWTTASSTVVLVGKAATNTKYRCVLMRLA